MFWHEEATMKSETKKMISVFLVSFLLFGCNGNSESKAIRMGFGEYHGVSNPTSQVGLAFTTESRQSFTMRLSMSMLAQSKDLLRIERMIHGAAIRDMENLLFKEKSQMRPETWSVVLTRS